MTVGGDRVPCNVSYCILASGPEGWSLVSAEHIRSADDLHDCLVLFSARARNSLDSELWWSGDVDAVQQIPQSASGDQGFFFKSFDLVSVVERLIFLGVAPRSVVFIIFAFSLVALFFFLLIVFFLSLVMVGGATAAVALLPVLPEVLVSQVPRPQSRMVPPPEESHVAAPTEVAHSLVLVVQWADVQCSSGLCGKYEPSKIWK
jgi:hypothetical protein